QLVAEPVRETADRLGDAAHHLAQALADAVAEALQAAPAFSAAAHASDPSVVDHQEPARADDGQVGVLLGHHAHAAHARLVPEVAIGVPAAALELADRRDVGLQA